MAVDEREFSEFFASQYAQLCWLGLLLTGSRAEAEELAQEALVRTWWRWQLTHRPADPASYARQVLVNRHRSLLRCAAVEARWLARSRPEEPVVPAGDERAMVLWQAVQALPPPVMPPASSRCFRSCARSWPACGRSATPCPRLTCLTPGCCWARAAAAAAPGRPGSRRPRWASAAAPGS